MDNVKLSTILEEKGMDWLVAALIEGSIGYHSPKHAKILVERAVAGEVKDYCERCVACFNCDLMKMQETLGARLMDSRITALLALL